MSQEDWLTTFTKHLIREYWKPCGLDEWLMKQLRKKREEEALAGRKWMKMRAEWAVHTYTMLAEKMAEKHNKNICNYFNNALKRKLITKSYYQFAT